MAHEAVHVGHHVLPDLVNVGVYLALELLVNHVPSSASRFFSPTILAPIEGPTIQTCSNCPLGTKIGGGLRGWESYTTNRSAASVMHTLPANVNRWKTKCR